VLSRSPPVKLRQDQPRLTLKFDGEDEKRDRCVYRYATECAS